MFHFVLDVVTYESSSELEGLDEPGRQPRVGQSKKCTGRSPRIVCRIQSADFRLQTLYVLLLVVPPRPVQLVWKNSPRGLSTRS